METTTHRSRWILMSHRDSGRSTSNGFVWYPATGVFFANGNPTHGSNVFNDSVNNPFSAGDVGKTLIVYDPTSTPPTVNPQRFTIIGYSSVSTVTLNTTYLGTTTSVAPYEVIAL